MSKSRRSRGVVNPRGSILRGSGEFDSRGFRELVGPRGSIFQGSGGPDSRGFWEFVGPQGSVLRGSPGVGDTLRPRKASRWGFPGVSTPDEAKSDISVYRCGAEQRGVKASEDAGDRGAVGRALGRSRRSPRGWFPGVWGLSLGPGKAGTGAGGVVCVSGVLVALVGVIAGAPGALGITPMAARMEHRFQPPSPEITDISLHPCRVCTCQRSSTKKRRDFATRHETPATPLYPSYFSEEAALTSYPIPRSIPLSYPTASLPLGRG